MVKKFTKKQWWTSALIAVAIIASLAIYQIITAPRDLGSKLEYVGTYNSGCEWWQIPFYFGWCAGPSNNYYFATDLSKEGIEEYFKKAVHTNDSRAGGTDYNYDILIFKNKNDSQQNFEVGYFDDENTQKLLSLQENFKKTHHSYK